MMKRHTADFFDHFFGREDRACYYDRHIGKSFLFGRQPTFPSHWEETHGFIESECFTITEVRIYSDVFTKSGYCSKWNHGSSGHTVKWIFAERES